MVTKPRFIWYRVGLPWQKSMCFAAKGWLQGRAAKGLLVRCKSWCSANLATICPAANGWRFNLVAVCVAVACFLPVPVDGQALTGQDETVHFVPSPGDGCDFWVTMKQSRWRLQKPWHQRVAPQPY